MNTVALYLFLNFPKLFFFLMLAIFNFIYSSYLHFIIMIIKALSLNRTNLPSTEVKDANIYCHYPLDCLVVLPSWKTPFFMLVLITVKMQNLHKLSVRIFFKTEETCFYVFIIKSGLQILSSPYSEIQTTNISTSSIRRNWILIK